MKKIISIALCAVMLTLSAVSASAASLPDKPTVDDTQIYYFIGTETIPDNVARVYKYGEGMAEISYMRFVDNATSEETIINLPESDTPSEAILPSTEGYRYWHFRNGSGNDFREDICFNNTGGTYQKMRIKLSDFSDYFNPDGTHTKTIEEDTHNYNFTVEDNGHSSSLVFVSGGAISFAVPDENGFVEIYVSPNIGDGVLFATNFRVRTDLVDASTSGSSGQNLRGLTVGDTDEDNCLAIDDATLLQKCIAGQEAMSTNSLAQRRNDTNGDGVVNISDVTAIQKYLVGMD